MTITITKEELQLLEEALDNQYSSNMESDHEMLQEEISRAETDWDFAASLCFKFQEVHDAFKLIKKIKERNKISDEKKSENESGSNSE